MTEGPALMPAAGCCRRTGLAAEVARPAADRFAKNAGDGRKPSARPTLPNTPRPTRFDGTAVRT